MTWEFFVLMLNESPIGVYSAQELADKAADEHLARNRAPENATWYYWTRSFVLDDSAGRQP